MFTLRSLGINDGMSVLFVHILFITCSLSYPEQGKWELEILGHSGSKEDQSVVITKSQYKNSVYEISGTCHPHSKDGDFQLKITWFLRKAICWKEYYETSSVNIAPTYVFDALQADGRLLSNDTAYYLTSSEVHDCDDQTFFLSSINEMLKSQKEHDAENAQSTKSYIKRPFNKTSDITMNSHAFYIVPYDGIYQLILGTAVIGKPIDLANKNYSYTLSIHISIKSEYGFLSGADYPLLVFYSLMCVVYVAYALAWLVVSFMRWRELLRVQYWIGAVIFLGMIEKAVFTAEYESVNRTGVSVPGLIVFAELVSCAKRTLARLLVIIVSFGFGIVKPRLGVVLNRVVIVGLIYFVLASVEGCMRILRPRNSDEEYDKHLMFTIIPLALLESGICWWVFSSLWATTRTLQLRRNTIKLNLYRHFTHVLIFAVLLSVVFMAWSIRHLNYNTCLSDWKQLWVNDAVWHVLFAIILLVIIVLWRPTNNNQRFAFSPLLDDGSDAEDGEYGGDETEKLMADVSDSMKLRHPSSGSNATSLAAAMRDSRPVDDDLRWAEENIPSAATDTGMPVMDSDEEVLISKFEISKMQ